MQVSPQESQEVQIPPKGPSITQCDRPTTLDLQVVHAAPAMWLDWQLLEERIGASHLMCSATWTRIWVETYGNEIPHTIVMARNGNLPVGFALLTDSTTRNGPLTVRTLHLGTAGENEADSVCVEYNRLLVEDYYRESFIRELLKFIYQLPNWELLQLNGMASSDAQAFQSQMETPDVREVNSHYCDLNLIRAAPSEPWRIFGDSTRSNLRRSIRDLGNPVLEWAESAEQALRYYDELIIYHQARWNADGKPGAFASEKFSQFHREVISQLTTQQRVTLVRARQGDRPIGLLYLLIENNRILYYQAGIPEYTSKLSLGCVTQYLTMVEGARRGYDAFDFLAGDARYKMALSTHANTLRWISLKRRSVKFMLMDGLRALKRALT